MTGIRPLAPGDEPALQALLEATSGYSERVTGYPTGPSDALSLLIGRPPDLPEDAKRVLGAGEDGGLRGCVDLLLGHPDPGTATIGVLLVRPDVRREGLGRALTTSADALAAAAGLRRLRLGVVDTARDCDPFWAALGFRPEGDAVPYRYDHLRSTVRHWTRAVPSS